MKHIGTIRGTVLAILFCGFFSGVIAQEGARVSIEYNGETGLKQQMDHIFSNLDRSQISTGILHDKVVSFSAIDKWSGLGQIHTSTLKSWRQVYYEMYQGSVSAPSILSLDEIESIAGPYLDAGMIALAIMDINYNRIREDALQLNLLRMENDQLFDVANRESSPYLQKRVFAGTVLKSHSYMDEVTFILPAELIISNHPAQPLAFEVDLADGRGYQPLRAGEPLTAYYASAGEREIRFRIAERGAERQSAVRFTAKKFDNGEPYTYNLPDIYWENEVSNYDYLGGFASYDAYVFFGEGNTEITKPLLFIEGFDLDNSLGWPELLGLISQEGLADSMDAGGYDLIIMNFQNATEYLQRNSLAAVTLIEKILAERVGSEPLRIAGASMGGLVSRYSLAWMEANGIDHQTDLLVTVDSPNQGANVPLGDQFWVEFFADHNDTANDFLALLDAPAPQQMLIYHHLNVPDPDQNALRNQWLADIAALGEYPVDPDIRLAAMSNGAGTGAGSGQLCNDGTLMQPGEQILYWHYSSFLVDVTGDVWAVPNGGPNTMILDAKIDQLWPFPNFGLTVWADNTLSLDNAPGGYRATQSDIAATDTDGLGDITTACNNHNFIPTISALDVRNGDGTPVDLFYDLAADGDLLSKTPFDAIYFPAGTVNEEHVQITVDNAAFFMEQLNGLETAAPVTAGLTLLSNSGSGTFTYTMSFENTTNNSESVSIWADVTGPGGYSALVFVRNKNFPAGTQISKNKSYTITGSLIGDYTMTLYTGTYPDVIMDSDSKVYTKNAVFSESGILAANLIPESMELAPNYPNPFNPSTTIRYGLSEDVQVSIKVFNTLGQEVATLVDGFQRAGYQTILWNGRNQNGREVASGIYLYKMVAGKVELTSKMLLAR